ncbi:MAG TPA: hypothetical protein ENK51_10415 [Gammaproteobacteria bacterium]|nr:hypothetical protein [Gammaproteobacteria bacterium]
MQAKKANQATSVYLVGSGIAGLASAVYLIEDAGVRPENITLLEQYPINRHESAGHIPDHGR